MENNEDLQEEFKRLLVKIEPHIVKLKSNLDKLVCREWLHKLFKTGKHEESLRNAYLTKMFEQLENGKLKEPFDHLPKHKSPLLPLTAQKFPKPGRIIDLSKKDINVLDKNTIITEEKTFITDVVNVHKALDAPKSTENHEHTNEIKVNESSNQVKQLDVNEIADDSKEAQLQKLTIDKSEGGDGLTLNVETKLKLESVEKMSNELKKKTDLLAEQVQEMKLYTDKNLINDDQITVLYAELSKYKNDMENMCNREAADELGASKLLQNILDKTTILDDKIVSEMHRLQTIVEDACASKKSRNFIMEQLKEEHRLKMDEKDKFHAIMNKKLLVEISQLKEYVSKVEEEAIICKQFRNENYYEDECSST